MKVSFVSKFHKINSHIKTIFGFSSIEIKAMWLLFPFAIILLSIPFIMNKFSFDKNKNEIDTLKIWVTQLEKINKSQFEKSNEVKNTSKTVQKDINLATAEDLKKIYGIGDKLSDRIVSFRNGLGGFATMNQLSEVYGISPEAIEELKRHYFIKNTVISVLWQEVSYEILAKHPYIGKKLASKIIYLRNQSGVLSKESLLTIEGITDSLIVKCEPYFHF